MTTFNECIQKRIDITAYEPDTQEQTKEFMKILGHNHGIIHQCSREAGFRIQSDPHYNGAIEAELWDSLNALRRGKQYAKSSLVDQEKLAQQSEQKVRYADHESDETILNLASVAFLAAFLPAVFILVEESAVVTWSLAVGLSAAGIVMAVPVLAGVYLHYRK